MRALWSLSPNTNTQHTLTAESIKYAFQRKYGVEISSEIVLHVIKRMENLALVEIILDPYAETTIVTSDDIIGNFATSTTEVVISRGWNNEAWLRSAFSNSKLWDDVVELISESESMELVPSSDGFVTVNHNSHEYEEVEKLVVQADEALRCDNEIQDDGQKSWIRIHIEAGLVLLRRGGPILRSALVALIVEPLKAAIKATANENVKSLISTALSAFLKWFI